MSMAPPSRVLFRERQRLRSADLRAEQEYLLALAGRHHFAPHTWGVLRGFSISLHDNVATIQPGIAIDGYGRELAVFQPVRITLSQGPASQYVYLYYCERPQGTCGTRPSPRFLDSAETQITHESWANPTDDPPLTEAIAAGQIPNSPFWPVLLG